MMHQSFHLGSFDSSYPSRKIEILLIWLDIKPGDAMNFKTSYMKVYQSRKYALWHM